MKTKVKSRLKRIVTGLLAMSMVVGLLPQYAVPAKAATTKTVSLSSMGRKGTVDVGSKTKSGTWWKMRLDGKSAFCLDLGKTCHSGNTYVAGDTHKWNQSTGGEKAPYYARVARWYAVDCKHSKKSFIMSQALIWAISEGSTSETNLKKVIKQIQDNTGYYSSSTANALYRKIFEYEGAFEAQCTVWTKSGASKNYQRLLMVDADVTPLNYHTIDKSTYYRQRVTVQKNDEDGKGLGGIKFSLSSNNLDDLYSFSVYGKGGNETSSADEDDIDDFELEGETTDSGHVSWRMTFKLFSNEMVYYSDSDLADMSADQKKAAKEKLEDDGYKQGVDFGKNMTKAEAQELMDEDIKDQIDDISNTYVLTEKSVGSNKNIFLDPVLAKGEKFTLTKANSWQKNKDGDWPDLLEEHPTQYSKAYQVSITNKYKKATIKVKKKAGNTSDGKAHGDASLEGAVFQLYSDAGCTNKATVYDKSGNAKTAGTYTTGADATLTTDYLRSGNTYYIKEIAAPKGFIVNETPQAITIDASSKDQEFSEVVMEKEMPNDEIKGKIAINKNMYDPTGKITTAEKNVTFQVYLKSKKTFENCLDDEKDTIKTDEKGHAETKDLVYGTYVIHQVDSGDEDTYLVPDFEMEIAENGVKLEENKVNEQFKAYLKIIKKDKNTKKTVLKPGTSYQIYKVTTSGDGEDAKTEETLLTQKYTDEEGNEQTVDTFTCDESGEVQAVDSIKSGTYRLYEVAAANGYHKNDEYIEIVINSKSDNYESYIDEDGWHHVTITVEYTNEETKGKLNIFKSGEVLKAWDEEKHNFVYEDVKLDGVEFTIYADGDIETQDAQFTETDGEKKRDTWFKDGDTVGVITTGKGVEFTSECGGLTGYEMDEDGTIHISLPLGKYKIVETKTPYGYVYPDTKEWSVEFKWVDGLDEYVLNSTDTTDETGTLKIKNAYAAPSLDLLKQDEKSKEVIPGAVFGLYAADDIYNYLGEKIVEEGALLCTYTTDEDGKIHSDMKLPLMSEGYGVKEEVDTSSNASGEAIFVETPAPTEVPTTTDAPNASGDAEKADIQKDAEPKLNSGDYYIQEISVSDSYYKDETPVEIHLEYKDAESKTIEVSKVKENTQTTNEISKIEVAGSKELPGCKLLLTDKDGNKIISWTSGDKDSVKVHVSDEDGYINLKYNFDDKGNLHVGGLFHDHEYTLTETRPADGYVTAESITYQIKLIMASSLPAAPIEAPVKNPTSGDAISLPTITPVATETPSVDAATGSAVHVTYESVVEIKKEDGSFELMSDDKVVMKDEQTHIRLLKLDEKTGQALGGAKFEVLDSKGNVVKKLTTIDDDNDLVGLLVVGKTYTFKEVSAPKGYQLAKPVKITIKDTAEVQTVTVKDAPIPDTPGTPQTGKTAPVIPITLCLIAAIGGAILIFKKKK